MYQRKRYPPSKSAPSVAPMTPPPTKEQRIAPPVAKAVAPPPSHDLDFPLSAQDLRPYSKPIPTSVAPTQATPTEAKAPPALPRFRTAWNRPLFAFAAPAVTQGEAELPPPIARENPPAQIDTDLVNAAQAKEDPNTFLEKSDRNGFLKVETFLRNRSAPVSNVHLLISNLLDGQEILYADRFTDAVGIAENISLPAPPNDTSLFPNHPFPYATYVVRAQRAGFQTPPPVLVQIFENVTSILPIVMELDFEKEVSP